MPKGKPHNAQTKALAVAALLTGDTVLEVAAKYGIDKSVISRWRSKLPAGEWQRLATKKRQQFDDAVSGSVRASLESLTAQAQAVSDPEWIRKQSARDLSRGNV